MTRVNLVDPAELCDQHLIAELREIKRIPNAVLSGRASLTGIPKKFTVRLDSEPERGSGHVKFFYDKLGWLRERYLLVYKQAKDRGFNVQFMWPDTAALPKRLLHGWSPSRADVVRSRARILEAMPETPRYTTPKSTCLPKRSSVRYICAGDFRLGSVHRAR